MAARDSLALAVRRLERARLRRLDPEEVIAAWTALVEGRWSLIDHVERDGRRLVLAHRNETASSIASLRAIEARVATLAALGHGDKYIAYELGLQRSTVASHLRRALLELRSSDRRDLITTYGPLARLSAMQRTTHEDDGLAGAPRERRSVSRGRASRRRGSPRPS